MKTKILDLLDHTFEAGLNTGQVAGNLKKVWVKKILQPLHDAR